VAATSEPGRVVTNGMSQYSRAERNANSALVVNIDPEDFPGDLLVNSLSMVCPFPPAEKQALLEAATVADRATMLIALIEMSLADNQGPEGMLQ